MKVSIVFVTGRVEPLLPRVLGGLAQQSEAGDEIELVVIDHFARRPHELAPPEAWRACSSIAGVKILPPKPTIWQGAYRVTSRDWWAMSNARNTGLCVASHDYVAFLDDRCVLGGSWLRSVRQGEASRASVLAGSYEKREDGKITQDSRRISAPNGRANCGGNWLFGCTFAMPLEWALAVGGFEEGCDGLSFEDVIFGLNLEHAGRRIDFVPDLFVSQQRGAECANAFRRTDKGTSPRDKSHAALERFGRRDHTELTPDLRVLRECFKRGELFPIPDPSTVHRDWYDGQPIREMT